MFPLDQILAWLSFYRYWILFPIAVVEGPIITVLGGFLSSLGALNIYLVYFFVILGDLVGDCLYYAIGRWGRGSFVDRWGRYFGLSTENVLKIEKHFEKHSGKTLILSKMTHAIGTPILFAAGMAKTPFWPFIGFNLAGSIPKSLIFILIGFYFGEAYKQINEYLNLGVMIAVITVIMSLLFYYLANKLRKKLIRDEIL